MNEFGSIFLDKEECVYSVKMFINLDRTDEIGKMKTRLSKINNEIEIFIESETFPQNLVEKSSVTVRKADFVPIIYECVMTVSGRKINLKGEYRKKSVVINMVKDNGKTKTKVSLSNPFYDNSTVIFLLRTVAFGLTDLDSINIVNIKSGNMIRAEIKITGEENVECEIGEFKCIGIRLTLSDYPNVPSQKFLYDIQPPHHLIKNVSGQQIIEIKK